MPVLPLSLFVALILLYLLARAHIRGEIPPLMRAGIGLCALQAIIIAGNQHYHLTWLGAVQPVTAGAIPALLFTGFLSAARRRLSWGRDSWHFAGPALTFFTAVFATPALDIVIPFLFLSYGSAILIILKDGPDAALQERLEEVGISIRVWRLLGTFLILSAFGDMLIALDYLYGQGHYAPLIHAFSNSLTLLALGLAGLSASTRPVLETSALTTPAGDERHGTDEEIITRLEKLMESGQVYQNPDLTLAQLARKLTLPVKALSGAINRQTGMNVSQFVNGYRIKAACRLLEQPETNVTEAMLASGFQTKSNFNREFKRVTGKSPSAWRAVSNTIS
ncbi:helix-turn-helix domain-containing protein [Aestuariispira insulae]|uniref:AraC family transcriptional regulator n=1 Tax=Aestuariispira insulae TaxID=1461337 RepID=A0A3D9H6M8_9PROT|nr:AraC family transcriptional regulator [Aestuariispira insulae]RED45109.1 AraC family transcriptional regulator [Aestuariispira insulae]